MIRNENMGKILVKCRKNGNYLKKKCKKKMSERFNELNLGKM